MKDKTNDLILTGMLLIMLLIITTIVVFCISIYNMIIDHKCYMMSDEEFFQSEQCKPYWEYRQEGKK